MNFVIELLNRIWAVFCCVTTEHLVHRYVPRKDSSFTDLNTLAIQYYISCFIENLYITAKPFSDRSC